MSRELNREQVMNWTPEVRIEVARRLADALREESRGVISSWRVAELSELLLFVLSMPESFLNQNAAKFRKWR
jgi:hypothetical protein